jgi:hypothetical protein
MKQRILAEGNDIHLILQVCTKHGLHRPTGFANKKDFESNFAFKSKKGNPLGKDELIDSLSGLLLESELQAIGIVLDADKSAISTWQSICAVLQNSGYTDLPACPNPEGTIIASMNPDLPKVGIWIMPDNYNPGEIEDFFLQLIDQEDFRLAHARNAIDELIRQRPDLLSDSNRSKAEAHTWLAWQKEPGRSMGVALKSNWTNAEHPLAIRLAEWFSKTFDLEPEQPHS